MHWYSPASSPAMFVKTREQFGSRLILEDRADLLTTFPNSTSVVERPARLKYQLVPEQVELEAAAQGSAAARPAPAYTCGRSPPMPGGNRWRCGSSELLLLPQEHHLESETHLQGGAPTSELLPGGTSGLAERCSSGTDLQLSGPSERSGLLQQRLLPSRNI